MTRPAARKAVLRKKLRLPIRCSNGFLYRMSSAIHFGLLSETNRACNLCSFGSFDLHAQYRDRVSWERVLKAVTADILA